MTSAFGMTAAVKLISILIMSKRILSLILFISIFAPVANSQLTKWCKDHHVADNLDVAFTLGTGGLGLEAATPVTKWAKLRAGFEWIPSIRVPMNFDLTTFTSDGLPSDNFSHVQELVYRYTGLEMDNSVKMIGEPTICSFKLLVDVFPFQNNKHWHFTAGFYLGGKSVAKAYNDRGEMPTLVGLNIYNRMYSYFTGLTEGEIFDVYIGGGNYMDPADVLKLKQRLERYGRIGIHVGDYKNGEPYYMEPDSDGKVKAKAFVNCFRPYLGFGYSGAIDAAKRWNVGVEAGAIFWGGAPDVIVHDGVNMTKDLKHVRGRVGDYLDLVKALPVYPSVNFKISYTFF